MQPLDQGIIHATKAHYRHFLIQFILDSLELDDDLDFVRLVLFPFFLSFCPLEELLRFFLLEKIRKDDYSAACN